jgi:hypothetical protein
MKTLRGKASFEDLSLAMTIEMLLDDAGETAWLVVTVDESSDEQITSFTTEEEARRAFSEAERKGLRVGLWRRVSPLPGVGGP